RDGGDTQRLRQQHAFDRIGQMIVQAGVNGADVLSEAQHNAEFFRLHAEESGQSPDRQRANQDQRDTHTAEMSARQKLLQLVLAAPQKVLQIGGPRPDRLRTAAPWSLGTLAPWASALILPRHINSPLRGTRVRLLGRMP